MNRTYVEYIDSDYRLSGTSSNFTYSIKPPANYNKCCVVSASIPRTWYLVQDGYNTFTITEASGTRTITVPIGDYTISAFRTAITTLINTGTTYTYSIAYPATTSKFIYSVTGNAGFQPTFTFPTSSVLYRLMGFDYATTNTFSANSLAGGNIPLFQHTNVVFIRSNLQKSENSSLSGDILAQIASIGNPQLAAVVYNAVDIDKQAKDFDTKSTVFSFKITDSDGFVLDLNGIPLNIEIVFFNADVSGEISIAKALLDNNEKMISEFKKSSSI